MKRLPVEALFTDILNRTERSLDVGLGAVLEMLPAADVGGLARTIGGRVQLAREAAALPRPQLAFVIAHELAHVAQKQRWPSAAPSAASDIAALEHEADAVAAHVIAGRRAHVRLADAPARPAYWGELGHYYTSYYVMIAAGMNSDEARLRAFFCQLPDQVKQFDATCATRDFNEAAPGDANYSAADLTVAGVGWAVSIPRATPDDEFSYVNGTRTVVMRGGMVVQIPAVVESPETRKNRLQRDQEVIQGLHCLTGAKAGEETGYRTTALKNNWSNTIVAGLALHPFGDSYAHRSTDKEMFGSHHGHALAGHDPDYVTVHPDRWLAYAKALYDLIPGGPKVPFDTGPGKTLRGLLPAPINPLDDPRVYEAIDRRGGPMPPMRQSRPAGKEADDVVQSKLKGVLRRMGADLSYEPEREQSSYWRQFAPRHTAELNRLGGADVVRGIIVYVGQQWMKRNTGKL